MQDGALISVWCNPLHTDELWPVFLTLVWEVQGRQLSRHHSALTFVSFCNWLCCCHSPPVSGQCQGSGGGPLWWPGIGCSGWSTPPGPGTPVWPACCRLSCRSARWRTCLADTDTWPRLWGRGQATAGSWRRDGVSWETRAASTRTGTGSGRAAGGESRGPGSPGTPPPSPRTGSWSKGWGRSSGSDVTELTLVLRGHWRLSICPWLAVTSLRASFEESAERGLVLVTEYWARAEQSSSRPRKGPRADILLNWFHEL